MAKKIKDVFYIDEDGKKFTKEEVSDSQLEAILFELAEGQGDEKFFTKDKINKIFEEAYARKGFNPVVLLALHSWALHRKGFGPKPAKHYFEVISIVENY